MLVGASSGGIRFYREVCEASDIILVHGNAGTEQSYYNMIRDVKALSLNKPIVCNEDSPRFTQLKVAYQTGTSWGYYNTHTKAFRNNWSGRNVSIRFNFKHFR